MSLTNEEFNSLDPRGLVKGNTNLWVINSNNPKVPLLRGNVIIPCKLLDFTEQYCERLVLNGTFFHKFNICFWETDKNSAYYKNHKNIPQYNGDVELYTPGLEPGMREAYEQAVLIRNRQKRRFNTYVR